MNEKIELTDAEYFGMAFIYVHKETKKVKVLNVDLAKNWHKTPDADTWTHTSTINTHLYLESLLNESKAAQNKSLKGLVGK
jgi:hypothetical protein